MESLTSLNPLLEPSNLYLSSDIQIKSFVISKILSSKSRIHEDFPFTLNIGLKLEDISLSLPSFPDPILHHLSLSSTTYRFNNSEGEEKVFLL